MGKAGDFEAVAGVGALHHFGIDVGVEVDVGPSGLREFAGLFDHC